MPDKRHNETALVVEDEVLFRMEVCDILADEGYAVVEAANAAEALRLLDDGISLIVTDVRMPGAMDGLGLVREVARSRPGVAMVVVSAQMTPGTGDLPDGVPFVGRPFLESRIRAAVRQATRAKDRNPRS